MGQESKSTFLKDKVVKVKTKTKSCEMQLKISKSKASKK